MERANPMENHKEIQEKIAFNNKKINESKINNILILYEERDFFLGDTCIRFNGLQAVKTFFDNANIFINCKASNFVNAFEALLVNNPNVAGFFNLPWEELAFETYDIVLCISYEEISFLNFLDKVYGSSISDGSVSLAVFSLSKVFLKINPSDCIFSIPDGFINYAKEYDKQNPRNLYITNQERTWADNWLLARGLQKGENLCILLDSTARADKLLNILVYFSLIEELLKNKKNKILIFDEKNIGKANFYNEWLGAEKAQRIIFAVGNTLREDLCIMSSTYSKLILGPCTGLIHCASSICASSIFNKLLADGILKNEIPTIIVYTGTYTDTERNAHTFWHNSPLVTCLMLRQYNNQPQMVKLSELDPQEADRVDNQLTCNKYTTEMLVKAITGQTDLITIIEK